MPLPTTNPDAQTRCPITDFVNLITGKWATPVLYKLILKDGPVRFSDLQRALSPITQKELTRHLRQFEAQGLVRRTVHPDMPPKVEYEITEFGKTLKEPFDGLAMWMLTRGEQLRNSSK
ncbi:MAG: helix-turn-helix transcriptional regulator [Cyanobacteria bacterium SZAS LIN-3]|nr:helix-turn-helix transcriptional regulator [Cyanobacteria bacterium SZAS LIN-3]